MSRGACLVPMLLLICLLLLMVLRPPFASSPLFAQSQPETLSFAAYQERLAAAASALEAGAELSDVQQELATIEVVRLPNQELLQIEPLLAGASNREAALARLRTVLAQLEVASRDRSTERLAQLDILIERLALDRPTLWQRIWRWIEDFIASLLPERMPRGAGTAAEVGSTLLVWTIVIGGALLLAILLSYWLRGLLGGILRDVALRRQQGDDRVPQTAAEAREHAHSFAQAGNYRQAVRQLYLSALLHLDEQGILRFERDQTNREVLAQVQPQTPVRSHLEPVIETFDRVWYGVREPDQQTFDAYRQEIDGLMAETGEEQRA